MQPRVADSCQCFRVSLAAAQKKTGTTYIHNEGEVVTWSSEVEWECIKCGKSGIKQGKCKVGVPGTLQPKAHSYCGGQLKPTNLHSIDGAKGYRVLAESEERKKKGQR